MPGSKEWLFLGEALGATPTHWLRRVYLGLKTGTIDGQDTRCRPCAQPILRGHKQVVMTSHLVDGISSPLPTRPGRR